MIKRGLAHSTTHFGCGGIWLDLWSGVLRDLVLSDRPFEFRLELVDARKERGALLFVNKKIASPPVELFSFLVREVLESEWASVIAIFRLELFHARKE